MGLSHETSTVSGGKCGPGMKAAEHEKKESSQKKKKKVDKGSRKLNYKMHQNIDEKKQF